MFFINCMLIFSITTLLLFRKKILTAFGLFYIGTIIFLLIGWLSAYFLAEEMYILNGNTEPLINIVPSIITFIIIVNLFWFFPHFSSGNQMKNKQINTDVFINKNINFIVYSTFILTVFFLAIINISDAPLFNIGKYTVTEMSYYRNEIFATGLISKLNVFRYIVLYLLIPLCFFIRAVGLKRIIIVDIVFIIFSALSLSKTAIILIIVFYFSGKYLKNRKLIDVLLAILSIVFAFYFIVYFTYYVDLQRSFGDVFKVLYIRLIATPIALSGLYSTFFEFHQGFRSSVYYTYLFGGEFVRIAVIAMQNISPTSGGNAPTGLIGMAFPNIPKSYHWFYYLCVISYIYLFSNLIGLIKNYTIKHVFVFFLGILSWFFFLTDPLVALNSYGILYISGVVIIILLLQNKQFFKLR
ncbi:O-antigen polymerase [Psychrobacillus sp. FSL K6-2836]|uniref:O-antigen polymerase n=1 Tax=Psychrobacillus sp. FSL K6-2836 TaxID=2921548 RepID=UPI0030FAD519